MLLKYMTEYKEGNHQEFITFLFSNEPLKENSILLESPLENSTKNINLHIFEQLLMIFVDGLKFFYGDSDGKVTISKLKKEDFDKVNQYFISMNYKVNLDIFPSINEYKFKFPNYFKNQEHITNQTKLEDFYYEIFNDKNCVFRIYFSII